MQYKVAALSLFAALAIASPIPDGLPDGTTCTISSTTTTKCVDGTCYAVNEGCSSRICAVPSGSEVGTCQTETKRSLFARDGLPDGTTCTIGSDTQTKCVDGTCYAVNEGCSSRICAVPSGSEVGTCQTETKRSLLARDGLPDGTTCTIGDDTETTCKDGTCYAVNEGCSSRICAVPSGSQVGSCETATKKRSLAARDGLPPGTICTIGQGVQTTCKDGTCYGGNAGCSSRICALPEGEDVGECWDDSASKKREAVAIPAELLEKRCTANGGSCTQLSQCCSGNCEYDSSIGLVCKA
ncbi:uncharacterized protein BKA78DRAFT_348994 [Phyllosticta capitalensis]|uniref:Uncharacterized protein n=1 Tax=Phyllosticta capitalensis TaxID=121624 RepID=A0ABR1Z408_9PEZI